MVKPETQDSSEEDVLKGLELPDTLDEFGKSGKSSTQKHLLWDSVSPVEKQPEQRFTSQVTFSASGSPASSQASGSPRPSISDQGRLDTELRIDTSSATPPINAAAPSRSAQRSDSVSSDSSSVQSPMVQREAFIRQHSRDFDVPSKSPQQEKKKWSVNLHPFVPTADVVNKAKSAEEQVSFNSTDIFLTALSF